LAEQAATASDPAERLLRFVGGYLSVDRRVRLGVEPPIAILSDALALREPHRLAVASAYVRLFQKIRALFGAGIAPRMGLARTYILLEQIFWCAAWLPRYDLDDYERVRDRMVDILANGLAPPGAEWTPVAMPQAIPTPAGDPEMSRETFLLAATRLINRDGYRGASVEKISAQLNVTKGSFYHHNEAKDGLVVACFERSFDAVRRVQTAAMGLPFDQWIKLSSVARTLVEHQLSEHGPLLRTSALSALPEAIRYAMVERSNRLSERFAAMISDGVAEGSLRAVDPVIAAQMLNATLNAAADLRRGPASVTQGEVAELYAKPMLMGLLSE
jgi:AcrR family transcriptional regulator